MFTKGIRKSVRARLLALLLVVWGATACAMPSAWPANVSGRGAPAEAQQSTEVAGAQTSGMVAGPEAQQAAPAPEPTAEQLIRDVVERGNQAQAAAIASHDQSVMAATSTERYFQELARINQRLLDGGVVAIKLVNLEWGAVAVDPSGTTATATTYETWRTTFTDGTVDDARDRNDYRLVRDRTGWRIDADEHPDEGPRSAAPPPSEPREPSPEIPRDR